MQTLYNGAGGIRVIRMMQPAEAQGLVAVLNRIAAELTWQPGDQLRACRELALHLAVIVEEDIVGGLQAVLETGKSSSLPYRIVWPEVDIITSKTAHVTMLALEKEYRGHPYLFGSLCVELWRCCVAGGIEQIVIEATPPTLRVYRRLGWPLEIAGDLRLHWGEECYLCRMGVQEVAKALCQKADRSASHRALVEQAYRDAFDKLPLTGTACV